LYIESIRDFASTGLLALFSQPDVLIQFSSTLTARAGCPTKETIFVIKLPLLLFFLFTNLVKVIK